MKAALKEVHRPNHILFVVRHPEILLQMDPRKGMVAVAAGWVLVVFQVSFYVSWYCFIPCQSLHAKIVVVCSMMIGLIHHQLKKQKVN